MRLKGALHVHSKLSHDGTLTVAELADWYQSRGYNFVALGEHSQDMDAEKIGRMKQDCAEHSGDSFLMIPGLEYSCRGGIHLFALGSTLEISETDPVKVATLAKGGGAFVILAHPSRLKWRCPADLVKSVNAAEFWNVAYDGKYLPSFRAFRAFDSMRSIKPDLLATGGQDFHRKPAFYDVAVIVETSHLARNAIMASLYSGNYEIRSRFFGSDSRAQFSLVGAASLRLLSWQLAALRGARNLIRG